MISSASVSRILVPLDGSALAEQAIPHAVALAGNEAQIILVSVTPEAEAVRSLLGKTVATAEDVGSAETTRAKAMLAETANRWKIVLGTAPQTEIGAGDPASEINAIAVRTGANAIVMASRGRGAIGRWAFGSVADRIARSATVPVLVIRPGDGVVELGPASYNRVIVPYDGSDLAKEALPIASTIAKRLKATVHLVRVVNPTVLTPASPIGEPAYPAQVYAELETELEDQAKSSLDEAAKELAASGVASSWEVLVGPPAAILEESAQAGDLIIMTSHGRSGFKRWLIGSVAEKLVREAKAPVMLVPATPRTAALAAEDAVS